MPDRNETYLTFLNGAPLAFSGGERPIALESEPAVLAAVAALPPDSEVLIQEVATSEGRARMAIVPVQLQEESNAGSVVMAYAVDRELEDLQQLGRIYAVVSLAQRRFLDDAGHELRTPITIVRGHLELLDPDDPVDVAETRVLLLDEVDRMNRMVADLILLSKAQDSTTHCRSPSICAFCIASRVRGSHDRRQSTRGRVDLHPRAPRKRRGRRGAPRGSPDRADTVPGPC